MALQQRNSIDDARATIGALRVRLNSILSAISANVPASAADAQAIADGLTSLMGDVGTIESDRAADAAQVAQAQQDAALKQQQNEALLGLLNVCKSDLLRATTATATAIETTATAEAKAKEGYSGGAVVGAVLAGVALGVGGSYVARKAKKR